MAGRVLTTQEKVRRQTKWIGYSERGILQILAADGTFDAYARVRGIAVTVRVIVRARGPLPETWAMAILVDNERVDGIDWERVVRDHRGRKFDCNGWHRHIWKDGDGNKNKECLPDFRPATRSDFVLEGFRILKVKLGRAERDDRQLSLRETSAG